MVWTYITQNIWVRSSECMCVCVYWDGIKHLVGGWAFMFCLWSSEWLYAYPILTQTHANSALCVSDQEVCSQSGDLLTLRKHTENSRQVWQTQSACDIRPQVFSVDEWLIVLMAHLRSPESCCVPNCMNNLPRATLCTVLRYYRILNGKTFLYLTQILTLR